VVSAVSVAATLISILSVGGAVGVADVGWGWAVPAMIFAALTVVLAVWASLPREDHLRPGDLDDVDRFFTGQIKRRGRLLRASGLTLCLALLAMPLPFLIAATSSPSAQLSLSVSRWGAALALNAHADHLSGRSIRLDLKLEIDKKEELLARRSEALESTVSLSSSLPLTAVARGSVVVARLYQGGDLVLMRCVHLGGYLLADEPSRDH